MENYNTNSINSADWWAYGDNYCCDLPSGFTNKASSIRFTGAPDDWKHDTLNMYFEEYFIGEEEFTYTDSPVLQHPDRAKSVIVTGCSNWTLYSEPQYQGRSLCVMPESDHICTPGLYTTSQSLGALAGRGASARTGGCQAHRGDTVRRGGCQAHRGSQA